MSTPTDGAGSDLTHSDFTGPVELFMADLDKVPWFLHVGEPLREVNVKPVSSWQEAWECLQDEAWTNATFHEEIDTGHPVWAAAYDRARDAVIRSGRDYELDENINVSLQAAHDAGAAAYQIAAGKPNGFFLSLMEWYKRGHWPCGWEGTYPDGKLIVY